MNFAVTFARFEKIELATITIKGEFAKLRRAKPAQSLGYHIPKSNDAELERCALYLSKERAAISADCNGYRVVKLA